MQLQHEMLLVRNKINKEKTMDFIINLMLKICNLTDNSFFQLFVFYIIVYVIIGIMSTNIEGYLDIEKKVYLRDLIIMFVLFATFAFNAYQLSNIKQIENKSYTVSKEK